MCCQSVANPLVINSLLECAAVITGQVGDEFIVAFEGRHNVFVPHHFRHPCDRFPRADVKGGECVPQLIRVPVFYPGKGKQPLPSFVKYARRCVSFIGNGVCEDVFTR